MTNTELKKTVADMLIDFATNEVDRTNQEKSGDSRRDGGRAFQALGLSDRILDVVQGHADDQAFKAVGECKHCYGKGYSSVLEPAHIASSDFEGDKRVVVKPSRLEYRFCKCERGEALKHLILTNAPWVLD